MFGLQVHSIRSSDDVQLSQALAASSSARRLVLDPASGAQSRPFTCIDSAQLRSRLGAPSSSSSSSSSCFARVSLPLNAVHEAALSVARGDQGLLDEAALRASQATKGTPSRR